MPADQATVSVFDSGFMQGVGLFTTMRAYNGRVFRLQQHIDRLMQSARTLGWAISPNEEALREAVEQVLAALEQSDARARLTVTTGSLRAGTEEAGGLTVVASAAPGTKYPEHVYQKGVTVALSKYRQSAADPIVGHKTTSYFSRLASLREAHVRGLFESLWLTPESSVAEGAISSVFVVKDDQLVTPPLDTPVLPGITRAAVIEAAVEAGVPAQERAVSVEELLAADEVFLTNCLMEIVPVVRVDRKAIGTEKIGDMVRDLNEAYGKLVERECGHGG
jgi:branched-subunit amino acid aminotransferase/4-amino-4-deoxychorismate lyase